MVDNIQEILVIVALPFAVIAAGITLALLLIAFLIVGFWRLFEGSSE